MCLNIGPKINGGFTDWSTWSICTKTCGIGNQARSRNCTNPIPQNGGLECKDNRNETRSCNSNPCPINGGFTEWSSWTACTRTCGRGNKQISRTCTNPFPQHGGLDCIGEKIKSSRCNTQSCPIHGGFSEWSAWTTCTKTCGGGSQEQSRTCTNPSPQHGGSDCSGPTTQEENCNDQPCPIDGGFTAWSTWTSCTKTCGAGSRKKTRTCTNPSPQHGGLNCIGESVKSESCNTQSCPINGGFSEWSAWTTCTKTCGGGFQEQSRTCTNPSPQYGGSDCSGPTTQQTNCNDHSCPINGGFTSWSTWTSCTKTCDGGTRRRTRTCTNPSPQHGGSDCSGPTTDEAICNSQICYFIGKFEKKPASNNWHYVTIDFQPSSNTYTWTNKANVVWKMHPIEGSTTRLQMDKSSTYYNDGFTIANFVEAGVYGPHNEFYSRVSQFSR